LRSQHDFTGRRDCAILVTLGRLGPRDAERRIGLAHVDWDGGEELIRGKGNRINSCRCPTRPVKRSPVDDAAEREREAAGDHLGGSKRPA
jgi:hypothetical protein